MMEFLTAILAEKFQVPSANLTSESTLEEMGLDSLDVVELCLVLETELKISVVDDDLLQAERLGPIVDLLVERQAETQVAVAS